MEKKRLVYEIWLGNTHTHFAHGIAHLPDGTTEELKTAIHSGMSCLDSVLIAHDDFDCDSLRWFIYPNRLKFYRIRPTTPDIIFHNESGRQIEIDDFGVMPNGVTVELQLYPDKKAINDEYGFDC